MRKLAPLDRTTFRELVDTRYVYKGMSASAAVATIFLRSGVSQRSVWNAYRGLRVRPETAARLREWAFAEHGIEDLDTEALMAAPVAPRRRA